MVSTVSIVRLRRSYSTAEQLPPIIGWLSEQGL
jgi:hypothetical protein